MLRLFVAMVLAASVAGCQMTLDIPERPVEHTISGSVLVPQHLLAAVQVPGPRRQMLASVLDFIIPVSHADIGGGVGGDVGAGSLYVPIPNVQVELFRLSYDWNTGTLIETPVPCGGGCPVTAADGTFTITTTEVPSSDLMLKVTFNDTYSGPADGSLVVMRALVSDFTVNVTPISEATFQIVEATLSDFVALANFTPNELSGLVSMIEDEAIDISGLSFNDAITKIKTDANETLSRFIVGFQEPSEVKVANPNDIFSIMELRPVLIAPNATYLEGAVNYKSSLGGAVSFDNDSRFQTGSAMYYWGLRSVFTGNPVRLFDQIFNELDQDPTTPAYQAQLAYGASVGFRGIVAANNGMALANSSTESTTAGFLSNDGRLAAFVSEKLDDVQSIYERGLRVMMKKWTVVTDATFDSYNSLYTNATIDYTANIANSGGNLANSVDLNPLMDQQTYNVILYQHHLSSNGIELGTATGNWFFDTTNPVTVIDGDAPSAKPHGTITVSNMTRDTATYLYSLGAVARNQTAAQEPCPNLFMIEDGGTLMLRRNSANAACNGINFDVMAGIGGVARDGEYFIVPQIHDDDEDTLQTEYVINGGAGRRGWYVGVKQQVGMTVDNISGIYHVVGQVSRLEGATDKLIHETKHGTLQFHPDLDDGFGKKVVTGTLHTKSDVLDQVYTGDANIPTLSTTKSLREDVSGTYQVTSDGKVTFTLPGTTETVTGIAGQMQTMTDGSKLAMFIAIPVKKNANNQGSRGMLLLAHEFVVDYPIPPDPPGPPAPPDSTPPLPPGI